MTADNDYMAFLNKANADVDASRSQRQSQGTPVRTGTVDVHAQIPAALTSIDSYYVSETDEPFEPVVLRWEEAKKGVWPGFCISLPSTRFLSMGGREWANVWRSSSILGPRLSSGGFVGGGLDAVDGVV